MSASRKSTKFKSSKNASPAKSMFSDKNTGGYDGLESVPNDLKETVKFLISRKVELRLKEEIDLLRGKIKAELG